MKIVQKVWGTEIYLADEAEYCAKHLIITPGYQCSLHYHPVKKETFVVESGVVKLEQRDVRGIPIVEFLVADDARTILPKTPHRFSSENGAVILEVSTHHEDSDVIRLEDSGKIQ